MKIRKTRPAASLVGRAAGRMMPSWTGAGGGACTLNTRPPCVSTSETISCLTPSSNTSNSSVLRSDTNCPCPSRAMTSVVTRSTATRNVGCPGACWAGSCAEAAVVRATARPRASNDLGVVRMVKIIAAAQLPPTNHQLPTRILSMRIAMAGDHAGFDMKRELLGKLRARGHDVVDLGTHSTDPVDYPDCADAVASALREKRAERGLI